MMSEVTFRPVVAEAAAAILAMRVKIAAQHAGGALGAQTAALASDECDTIVLRVWRAILADLPESSVRVIEKQVTVVGMGVERKHCCTGGRCSQAVAARLV